MAQNEMRAVRGMPVWVRLSEGLGCGFALATWTGDDNCFSNSIMNRLPVGVGEVLQEAEAGLERRRCVTKTTFDAMPQRKMVVNERHHADTEHPLPYSCALA